MSGITTFDKLVLTATEVFEGDEGSIYDAVADAINYLKKEEPKNLKEIFFEVTRKELPFGDGDVIDRVPISWPSIYEKVVTSCLIKRLFSNPRLAAENKKRPN